MAENKTNDLRFTINCLSSEGDNMTIKIRLNDECKNGHNDFSITGDIYEKGKPKTDRYYISGGCIHDEILKVRPDLKIFVDLHLSDSKGVPMYAIENGYYHLKNSGLEVAKDYLRLTEAEAKIIAQSVDKLHFTYLLHKLNIPEKWHNEAKKAIELLEQWTGRQFVDDSKKSNWKEEFTAEQIEAIKREVDAKIESGYYSEEQVNERQEHKRQENKKKQIEKLINDRDKDIKKANDEFNIKLAVLESGLSLSNFIYYTHSNEGRFNWLDYNKTITEDEFNDFVASVDYSKLPEGIKFKIGK